uniref:glutamine-rich protein 2-like n=1 Tax=Podarcis muralis TaxID=64176 RepID=UPI00109F7AB9|nr:glutamine-rich protein 2-like [Podarcis muralis]
MMASSSTLLSMSMPPTPEPGVAQVQSTCAACSLDVSEKVSQLFKRYEQLQDLINNFMLRQAEGKLAKKPKHRQDEEMLNQIQSTILQVQDDCEKLNATAGTLVEDHRQKQKEISVGDLDTRLEGQMTWDIPNVVASQGFGGASSRKKQLALLPLLKQVQSR